MIKLVSIEHLIARIETTFRINSTAYIHDLPLWITDALSELKVMLPVEPNHVRRTVVNNLAALPDDLHSLSIITKDNVPVRRSNKVMLPIIEPQQYNEMVSIVIPVVQTKTDATVNTTIKTIPAEVDVTGFNTVHTYLLHHSKVLEFSFESGIVDIYYGRVPTTTDELTGIRCPMIPDDGSVMQYLTASVLTNLLYQGYKHPILNLNNNSVYTNPAKLKVMYQPAARNAMMAWDNERSQNIVDMLTSFIKNPDYIERNFNV